MYQQRIFLGSCRFANMLFENIWKGYNQNLFEVLSDFQVCFLNIWIEGKQKIVRGILRFASMLF